MSGEMLPSIRLTSLKSVQAGLNVGDVGLALAT